MKKRFIFIPLGLIVLAFLVFSGLYLVRMNAETAKMNPLPTGQAAPDVFAIRDGYVNLYLVPCGPDWIVFDAGISTETVHKGLQELGVDPVDVKAVFLTHSDSDHTGALPLFRQATLYLSEQEEQMVNGQTKRAFVISNAAVGAHEILADGETVQVSGCKVTGILSPGHTPGSMVYIVNDADLFSGDAFSLMDGKVAPFNEFFNMDTPRQIESINTLASHGGFTTIFSGHYGMAPSSALR